MVCGSVQFVSRTSTRQSSDMYSNYAQVFFCCDISALGFFSCCHSFCCLVLYFVAVQSFYSLSFDGTGLVSLFYGTSFINFYLLYLLGVKRLTVHI